MTPAVYYTNCGDERAQNLFVKETNPDGTVELVNEKGELVIGKCRVTESPTVGSCVIYKPDTKPAADKKEKK